MLGWLDTAVRLAAAISVSPAVRITRYCSVPEAEIPIARRKLRLARVNAWLSVGPEIATVTDTTRSASQSRPGQDPCRAPRSALPDTSSGMSSQPSRVPLMIWYTLP